MKGHPAGAAFRALMDATTITRALPAVHDADAPVSLRAGFRIAQFHDTSHGSPFASISTRRLNRVSVPGFAITLW